jgi:hypothetical protein
MTGTLSPISLAAQQQTGTPYYGLVWLALAQLAYTDEDARVVKGVGIDLPSAVASLPDLPPPPGFTAPSTSWCEWRVDWGPVVTRDNSNLMFVATCVERASGLPILAAVSIRGTDTQEHWKALGLLQQLYEDLDVGHKVPWPHVVDDPSVPCRNGGTADDVAIAQGTCEGLKILRHMQAPFAGQAGTVDVLTAATSLATTHVGLPIVVTGHSLGGALTTVMAPFLAESLTAAGVRATIVPHAFAPPSAGTAGFAAKFDAEFPRGHIWWNTLDVVPNAFQNIANAPPGTPSMTHMLGFWQDHGGPKIGELEKLALDGFIHVEHAYAQPRANVMTLRGSVVTPGASAGCKNSWSAQLLVQHLTPQYHHLISTQLAGRVAPYPLPGTPDPCVQVPPAR